MIVELKLPQFGMGMTEGTIVAWAKSEGDVVEEGEVIGTVEAAKATNDLTAPVSGTLTKILVSVDETVPVRAVLAHITPR
jgi:pyruvate/2-oxoglutarate dehydrogenase complex dihydrolipoamide acyltransferase (E2) component